jgi:predicted phage tail protein
MKDSTPMLALLGIAFFMAYISGCSQSEVKENLNAAKYALIQEKCYLNGEQVPDSLCNDINHDISVAQLRKEQDEKAKSEQYIQMREQQKQEFENSYESLSDDKKTIVKAQILGEWKDKNGKTYEEILMESL